MRLLSLSMELSSVSTGLGTTFGYLFWYGRYLHLAEGDGNLTRHEASGLHAKGYHIPAVRRRDEFYARLEEESLKASR